MILSDSQILDEMKKGTIKVEPFRRECLGSNSYDVHLGRYLSLYKNQILDAKKHNEIETFEIPDEEVKYIIPENFDDNEQMIESNSNEVSFDEESIEYMDP
jgi:deoxycytidine triphosphate deaminase